MLNLQRHGSIVHAAVLVVVVADGAVQHVIAEDDIEGLGAGVLGPPGFRNYRHLRGNLGAAGADELAIDFDHAGVAGLDRAHEGRMITICGISFSLRIASTRSSPSLAAMILPSTEISTEGVDFTSALLRSTSVLFSITLPFG
jgi:hypothetical protein